MAADRDDVRKRDRDPILTVGTVVLILAFAVVIGIYVNDHYIADSEASPVHVGDSVKVNYTGSYYGYHTEDGSQVFDTSLWSIADDDDKDKSFEFTLKSKSSYTPLSFTIGGTDSYLAMFKNSIVGLRSGQTAEVIIPPSQGYGELTEDNLASYQMEGSTMQRMETVTLDTLKDIYGISTINGNLFNISTPYGWDAHVKYDGNGKTAVVEHLVTPGVYEMNENVSIDVTDVSNDLITFDYLFDTVATKDGSSISYKGSDYDSIRLVKIIVDNEERYVTAVDSIDTPTVFITKNTEEKVGMYLYFMVKLL